MPTAPSRCTSRYSPPKSWPTFGHRLCTFTASARRHMVYFTTRTRRLFFITVGHHFQATSVSRGFHRTRYAVFRATFRGETLNYTLFGVSLSVSRERRALIFRSIRARCALDCRAYAFRLLVADTLRRRHVILMMLLAANEESAIFSAHTYTRHLRRRVACARESSGRHADLRDMARSSAARHVQLPYREASSRALLR